MAKLGRFSCFQNSNIYIYYYDSIIIIHLSNHVSNIFYLKIWLFINFIILVLILRTNKSKKVFSNMQLMYKNKTLNYLY